VIRIDSQEAVPEIGQTIHVKPLANRLHWFDAQSLKRLES
jgi:sn-glycerol 3-phosphate transport system ATP-binding protein